MKKRLPFQVVQTHYSCGHRKRSEVVSQKEGIGLPEQ